MIKVLINKGSLCKFLIIGFLCALLMVAVNITSFDEFTAEQAFLAARDGFIELEEREFSAEPVMCSLWFLLFVPFIVQILTEDYETAKSFVFIRLKSIGKWYGYKMLQGIFYSLFAAFTYNFSIAVISVLSGYEIKRAVTLCFYTLYGTLSGALFLFFFVSLTYVMSFKLPSHVSTVIILFVIAAMMISITFIGNNKNTAKGSDKINSIYSKFGVEAMVEKTEKLTGMDINHYAVVKTEALIDIVDAIGGIEYNVPINMDYDDITQNLHIHLKSGVQLIDGEKAEQLLRFRHNNDGSSYPSEYGDNDFGRMRTQREFIKSVAKQTIRVGNVFKIPKISNAIFENVETDMNIWTIVKYIPSAFSFDMDSIKNYQLPGESKKYNSLWFYIPNSKETIKLLEELKK